MITNDKKSKTCKVGVRKDSLLTKSQQVGLITTMAIISLVRFYFHEDMIARPHWHCTLKYGKEVLSHHHDCDKKANKTVSSSRTKEADLVADDPDQFELEELILAKTSPAMMKNSNMITSSPPPVDSKSLSLQQEEEQHRAPSSTSTSNHNEEEEMQGTSIADQPGAQPQLPVPTNSSTDVVAIVEEEYIQKYHEEDDHTTSVEKNTLRWWVKLNPEDAKTYIDNNTVCNNPFTHCCIGQGRRDEQKIEPTEALWKWNESRPGAKPLAKFTDFLDYLERRKTSPQESCKISIWGDSLSSDTTMAATCELLQNGYTMTGCNPSMLAGPVYGDIFYKCDRNDTFANELTSHFVFEHESRTSCQKVVLSYTVSRNIRETTHQAAMDELLEYSKGGDGFVVIFNPASVHCNDHDTGCLDGYLEEGLIPFIKSDDYQNFTFMFREHEPQHFETDGGIFTRELPMPRKCVQTKNGNADNWRNEYVASYLVSHNLTEKVPTIPIFHDLVPLWQLHILEDCTHYIYNPFRFDLTWDRTLSALQEHDDNIKA